MRFFLLTVAIMVVALSLVLSFLALLATYYQAHLQRVHNQKSVKPLVQIDLVDQNATIAVHIQNNGIGPFIVKKLEYIKSNDAYDNIENCLQLNARSYQHISPLGSSTKIILPGTSLMVFSMKIDSKQENEVFDIRQQLSLIVLKATGVDIYDNEISVERQLSWFVRHNNK